MGQEDAFHKEWLNLKQDCRISKCRGAYMVVQYSGMWMLDLPDLLHRYAPNKCLLNRRVQGDVLEERLNTNGDRIGSWSLIPVRPGPRTSFQ
ncbi:MAG: hypothetical protein BA872_05630 [Desulfobacterales bacterium C00003060]|nr:MAG: hypothetical protein BA861_10375 [Desulfobacterales bacterium S3730MH5]OEU79591.1 MAG: hypothetical protein BA872_05630 [Desulfobacterales bacterium C00003060]